jgi:hypothetical protein
MEISEWFALLILIIFLVAFTGYTIMTTPVPKEQKMPEGCGLTDYNRSESYTVYMQCGKVPCPQTHYYKDMVCTNGTTMFKWKK